MRTKIFTALELLAEAKEAIASAHMLHEISEQEFTTINNWIENAHIGAVKAVSKDSLQFEREGTC